MMPRQMLAAELALLASGDTETVADGWFSLAVRGADRSVVAALSVHTGATHPEATHPATESLHAIGRLLEAELLSVERAGDAFLTDVMDGQRDAVAVLTTELDVKWVSQGIGTLVGRTPSELVGRSAIELLHPDDLDTAFDAIARIKQGLPVYRIYVRVLNVSNEYIPVEVTGNDLSLIPGVDGFVLSIRDAQHEREAVQALTRSRQVSDTIVESLRDGVVATDEHGAIVAINTTARTMFGIDESRSPAQLRQDEFTLVELDGRPHSPFADDHSSATLCCYIANHQDLRYITASRETIPSEDGSGAAAGVVVVFSDVTSEQVAAQELRNQARHDQLTGLANRYQLAERLVGLAESRSESVAACFVDLDGFKSVNDNYGHRMGDEVVRIAAQRLAAEIREGDILARHGGDEFVALLVDTDLDEASRIAEKFRAAIAAPYQVGSHTFDLTGSIGVAIERIAGLNPDALLQHADLALYAAKDAGRNRVEAFDDELANEVRIKDHKKRRLRSALDDNRVVMYFQPLIDTDSEHIVGYEALARIRVDDDTVLNPSAFLEGIASSALVWELDQAAFELSCRAANALASIHPGSVPYIACNFSSTSVSHPDFLSFLTATTTEASVSPTNISIELTESAAFDADAKGVDMLTVLRERGFRLALDDFGTGYSSLAHIRDLPISSIKVDRSFIGRLGQGGNEHSISEAVVGLARDLDIDVVAEGVETLEQLQLARALGFTTIQGWHYAPAQPLAECLQHWASAVDGQVGKDADTEAAKR